MHFLSQVFRSSCSKVTEHSGRLVQRIMIHVWFRCIHWYFTDIRSLTKIVKYQTHNVIESYESDPHFINRIHAASKTAYKYVFIDSHPGTCTNNTDLSIDRKLFNSCQNWNACVEGVLRSIEQLHKCSLGACGSK